VGSAATALDLCAAAAGRRCGNYPDSRGEEADVRKAINRGLVHNTRPRMRLKGVSMDEQRESQGPSAKIATSTVQLLHQHTGRGPTKATTTIAENIVTVLLADTLTKGERTLVENGRADRVIQLRHDYQLVMRDDLVGMRHRGVF
jgi:hypothetical protein